VLDEMKWFNGMRENPDEAVARLGDIGGPDSHCNIPWGWAQAGNTPLKWYKQNTHGGGVRDPLIVSWPAGIAARGELRRQFCHAIDIAPTVLDVVGVAPPSVVAGAPQMPTHGVSLKAALFDPEARIERGTQYFEMLGHRGVYRDGWKAVTHHAPGTPFEDDRWELYRLDEDFSECVDLAESHPDRLKALVEAWWAEAERHGVLPLDDRNAAQLFRAPPRPGLPTSRTRFVYRPPISHVVADACPTAARGWTTTIGLVHPALDGANAGDGALVARGSRNSGYALYVRDGRLTFDYNFFHSHTRLVADQPLAPGARRVELKVTRQEAGGLAELFVDGRKLGEAAIPRLMFIVSSTGMDLGRSLAPVNDDYHAPFAYPGRIDTVVFEVPPTRPPGELRATVRAEMVRQ
jgi:arylsulfatase